MQEPPLGCPPSGGGALVGGGVYLPPPRKSYAPVLYTFSLWKQYNKMVVLNFFRLNSTLYLFILFVHIVELYMNFAAIFVSVCMCKFNVL